MKPPQGIMASLYPPRLIDPLWSSTQLSEFPRHTVIAWSPTPSPLQQSIRSLSQSLFSQSLLSPTLSQTPPPQILPSHSSFTCSPSFTFTLEESFDYRSEGQDFARIEPAAEPAHPIVPANRTLIDSDSDHTDSLAWSLGDDTCMANGDVPTTGVNPQPSSPRTPLPSPAPAAESPQPPIAEPPHSPQPERIPPDFMAALNRLSEKIDRSSESKEQMDILKDENKNLRIEIVRLQSELKAANQMLEDRSN